MTPAPPIVRYNPGPNMTEPNTSLAKQRIAVRTVVIDDDETVCRRVSAWLAAAHYEVATFTEPGHGVRYAAEHPCALALVDVRMPDVDGTDVIAALRVNSPRTRVVAMGAFADDKLVAAAKRAGALDVLEKPIRQPLLLETIERHLTRAGIWAVTESDFNRKLGARLRALRQSVQRTLADVAGAGGLTPAQLSQIETGKTATSTWTLARICGALRVPFHSIFAELDGVDPPRAQR